MREIDLTGSPWPALDAADYNRGRKAFEDGKSITSLSNEVPARERQRNGWLDALADKLDGIAENVRMQPRCPHCGAPGFNTKRGLIHPAHFVGCPAIDEPLMNEGVLVTHNPP